jgi:hypothetical protein
MKKMTKTVMRKVITTTITTSMRKNRGKIGEKNRDSP